MVEEPGFIHRMAWAIRVNLTQGRVLAMFPLLAMAAYWIGDQAVLFTVSMVFPLMLAIQSILGREATSAIRNAPRDPLTDLPTSRVLIDTLDEHLADPGQAGHNVACLVIDLDEFAAVNDRWGRNTADEVLRRTGERIASAVRDRDLTARLEGDTFAVAVGPVYRMDLEAILSVANRIQRAVSEPISLDGSSVYVTCSIGYCLAARAPDRRGVAMLGAAEMALVEARRGGPSSVRGFSAEMKQRIATRDELSGEVTEALESGQFVAWFQPQLATDTGEVSGFEALARWVHPVRGMIPPGEFLPAIDAAGRWERLGEVMLYQSLSALQAWDKARLKVPQVGVNFSDTEFANPGLADKISWELDRFELDHSRLAVEILENVIASASEDVTLHNIKALARLGCQIDLDDFGTGNASITTLKRFPVGRIKIDRSFVTRIDEDKEQRAMAAAILTLADKLNLETLAEGVETMGELATLTRMGCGHVQGFGLAKPMPLEETIPWLTRHQAKLTKQRNGQVQLGSA